MTFLTYQLEKHQKTDLHKPVGDFMVARLTFYIQTIPVTRGKYWNTG